MNTSSTNATKDGNVVALCQVCHSVQYCGDIVSLEQAEVGYFEVKNTLYIRGVSLLRFREV